jgi:hypothetical protein
MKFITDMMFKKLKYNIYNEQTSALALYYIPESEDYYWNTYE